MASHLNGSGVRQSLSYSGHTNRFYEAESAQNYLFFFSSGVHAKSLQLKLMGKNSHLQLRAQLKWTLRPPAKTIQPHAPLQRVEMTGWAFGTTRWRTVWWKVRDECSLIQCEQNIYTLCERSERQVMTSTRNQATAFRIYNLLQDKNTIIHQNFAFAVWI